MTTYSKIEGMPENVQFHGILEAYERIFKSHADPFAEEMKEKRRLVTFTAAEGLQLVGFKMGYERKKNQFNSWVGGVLPNQRGRGIGSELMRRQHEWCRLNGYQTMGLMSLERT